MSRYWLGCSGWAYDDWVGPFYPPGTPPGEFLERYARVFRTVEVDSTFYRAPGPSLVRRWADRTPDGFRFALKVPREVTHEATPDAGEVLERFVASLEPLRAAGKLGPVVLQFPPSFRRDPGAGRLERLLARVPPTYALAVELRHRSWWVDATRQALAARRAALVWSVLPAASPPDWVTGEFLYARFVGDRALTEFGGVQRPGRTAMEAMRARFDGAGREITTIFAYSNNHFMGFGPGSTAELAAVLGAPVPDLTLAARAQGQRTLDTG